MNFELNEALKDRSIFSDAEVKVGADKEKEWKSILEVCSAMFKGEDEGKFGKTKDAVVNHIKDLGNKVSNNDPVALAELNSIVKYLVRPRLLESTSIYAALGNFHDIPYHELPMIQTYKYEDVDARFQAASGDATYPEMNWAEYPVVTKTITSGLAVDYREIQAGNFAGSVAEMMNQVQTDMNNKGVKYCMDILHDRIKNAKGVKFYDEYSDNPTQAEVDGMLAKTRRIGKTSIIGDYSVLSVISGFNGYKMVGEAAIPFFTPSQVEELAKTGLIGAYKGSTLIEMPNPYNFTKPLATKDGFETYFDTDKAYFIPAGAESPFHIFRRGGITTMSANDVKARKVLTRFDMEIGADVVKGREYEIGLMAKAE